MDSFKLYPRKPNVESDTTVLDMKETGKSRWNPLIQGMGRALKQRLEQDLKNNGKERVEVFLKKKKKIDKSQQHIEHIQREVETGKATEDTYNKMYNINNCLRKRVLGFIERAYKYNGNLDIIVKWCETQLIKD